MVTRMSIQRNGPCLYLEHIFPSNRYVCKSCGLRPSHITSITCFVFARDCGLTWWTCRTDKYFNQIATPFLYKELNIFPVLSKRGYRQFQKYLLEPYWNHVTTLFLLVDMIVYKRSSMTIWVQTDKPHHDTLSTLSTCKNVRRLALYYSKRSRDFRPLVEPILDLLVNHQLRSLGIFSKHLLVGHETFFSGKESSMLRRSSWNPSCLRKKGHPQ
jgi:hypothetical protein